MEETNPIRALRKSTGMNRKDFCEFFDIPYRTVTDWELGHRHPPEYVTRLLAYYIQHEGLIREAGADASDQDEGSVQL